MCVRVCVCVCVCVRVRVCVAVTQGKHDHWFLLGVGANDEKVRLFLLMLISSDYGCCLCFGSFFEGGGLE